MHCIYVQSEGDSMVVVAVYVDDLLIATNDPRDMERIKTNLKGIFRMKDLGPLHYCLIGIEFKQEEGLISMNQKRYISEVLERFGMTNCNPVGTPLVVGGRLSHWKCRVMGVIRNSPIKVSSDSALCQFNSCHSKEHWNAAN